MRNAPVTMAISARQAFAVLTDHGLEPDDAMRELKALAPHARFAGAPYYNPAKVYQIAGRLAP